MASLFILVAIFVFLALLAIFHYIFPMTAFRAWMWKYWFPVFVTANLLDVLSTFLAVYVSGGDWSGERNIFVKYLGSFIGFSLAIIVIKVLSIGVIGILVKRFSYELEVQNGIYFISLCLFLLTINNLVQFYLIIN